MPTSETSAFPSEVDAVVCGGGPGGSTFATLMARNGYKTVLFEREKFPVPHRRSLLPGTPLFDRSASWKLKAVGPR
jgi:flavin-dependent dehydrogenase